MNEIHGGLRHQVLGRVVSGPKTRSLAISVLLSVFSVGVALALTSCGGGGTGESLTDSSAAQFVGQNMGNPPSSFPTADQEVWSVFKSVVPQNEKIAGDCAAVLFHDDTGSTATAFIRFTSGSWQPEDVVTGSEINEIDPIRSHCDSVYGDE